jgi:hypothetical protein
VQVLDRDDQRSPPAAVQRPGAQGLKHPSLDRLGAELPQLGNPLTQTEKMQDVRRMLVGLESNLLQSETDLSDHHLRRISFADPAVGADHVDDRHVRDAASVGQTSALQIRHLGPAEAAAKLI